MQSPNFWHPQSRRERGQTTIALVGVMVLVCVIGLAISTLADAMVHRARARTAADAAALASAADPVAAAGLIDRYRALGISIEQNQSSSSSLARSGPAHAVAWAENTAADDVPAPALVAIIARAEQLTSSTFSQLRWDGVLVELPAAQAVQLRLVALDLGLCERSEDSSRSGWNLFELC